MCRCTFILAVFLLAGALAELEAGPAKTRPKSREFLFSYQALVSGLLPGQTARIWLPVPTSSTEQEVVLLHRDLPAEGQLGKEPRYGNQILYVEAKARHQVLLPLTVIYRIQRWEIQGAGPDNGSAPKDVQAFLQPDARVPVGGQSLTLLQGKNLPQDQVAAARVLFDVVNGHMRHSKE